MSFTSVFVSEPAAPVLPATRALLERRLTDRGLMAKRRGLHTAVIELIDDPALRDQSYSITRDETVLRISGGGPLGVLYGIGRFLRTANFSNSTVDIASVPEIPADAPSRPLRALYLATHFSNYYQTASLEEVTSYVEDCVLWGYNTIVVWFDRHEHHGFQSASAQHEVSRLNVVLDAVRALGVDVGLTMIANEGYANSPTELRADHRAGQNGYHSEPYDHYHVEICPSQPGALSVIADEAMEVIHAFEQHGSIRYVMIWPYDQGGCTCETCAPWGANGFLRTAEHLARTIREVHPATGIILSTWYFDHFVDGEWSGLADAFRKSPDWVDYLIGGDFGGLPFPDYPRINGAPGNLPMISFPEVSMNGMTPWGAIGANVRPREITKMWGQVGGILQGGVVYSEGIFEDLNKALIAQLMWGREDGDTITAEYCAATFGQEHAEAIARIVIELERTTFSLPVYAGSQLDHRPELVVTGGDYIPVSAEALTIDALLDDDVRRSWRWRILLARCVIQDALHAGGGLGDETVADFLDELTDIYRAQDAMLFLRPPMVRGYTPSRYGTDLTQGTIYFDPTGEKRAGE